MRLINGHGMGWLRDLPDARDYIPSTVGLSLQAPAPTSVDLRQWCSPIKDQGNLGSCTAFAGTGLVEYAMRRALGRHVEVSPLFLYKVTRNLMGWTGDSGAYLRDMLKALAACGVPPEGHWPYEISQFDTEPTAFEYVLGQSYQAIKYIRLDSAGVSPPDVLRNTKLMLVRGIPSVFGFTVYDSISEANATGEIPYPRQGERVLGGHALVRVGYDDSKMIRGTQGAYLIRNSWGKNWGISGYGWIPYYYDTQGLAVDSWAITKQEWLDTGLFD